MTLKESKAFLLVTFDSFALFLKFYKFLYYNLSMMGKFSNSWRLLKHSMHIIGENKKLLVFPLLTTIAVISVSVVFLSPIIDHIGFRDTWLTAALFEKINHPNNTTEYVLNALGISYLVLAYLSVNFVRVFFNTVFYHEILNALEGKRVAIKNGLIFSLAKIKVIALWSLLSGLVALVIHILSNRPGPIKKFVIRLIGVAWEVASIFTIPVIASQNDIVNPVQVLKKSANTLKQTWGETLIGFTGIKLIGFVMFISFFVIFMPLSSLTGHIHDPSPASGSLTYGIWFTLLIFALLIIKTANDIYRCALYVFAKDKRAPNIYTEEMLNSTLKFKKD